MADEETRQELVDAASRILNEGERRRLADLILEEHHKRHHECPRAAAGRSGVCDLKAYAALVRPILAPPTNCQCGHAWSADHYGKALMTAPPQITYPCKVCGCKDRRVP